MANTVNTSMTDPVKMAEFSREVEREKKLAAYRAGELSFFESEKIGQELCAQRDRVLQAAREKAQRDAERATAAANAQARGF